MRAVLVISHVLPLAAAADPRRMLERRHASGKIILDVTH
jgi:NADPH:quinone reductase-like Zn-dependent oxidoreductase